MLKKYTHFFIKSKPNFEAKLIFKGNSVVSTKMENSNKGRNVNSLPPYDSPRTTKVSLYPCLCLIINLWKVLLSQIAVQ